MHDVTRRCVHVSFLVMMFIFDLTFILESLSTPYIRVYMGSINWPPIASKTVVEDVSFGTQSVKDKDLLLS